MRNYKWTLRNAIGRLEFKIDDVVPYETILSHPVIQNARISNNFFILITNLQSMCNEYVIGDPSKLTGWTTSEIIADSHFLFKFANPEELPFIMKVIESAMNYTLACSKAQRRDIAVIYFHRAQNKTGRQLVIKHESIPIVFDKTDKPYVFCNLISDLTFLGVTNIPHATLINHHTQEYFHLDDMGSIKPKILTFTAREMDIIKLLARGNNSREISDSLFISKETVRTHRRNILRKSGLKNTNELISYVIKNGITY